MIIRTTNRTSNNLVCSTVLWLLCENSFWEKPKNLQLHHFRGFFLFWLKTMHPSTRKEERQRMHLGGGGLEKQPSHFIKIRWKCGLKRDEGWVVYPRRLPCRFARLTKNHPLTISSSFSRIARRYRDYPGPFNEQLSSRASHPGEDAEKGGR